MTGAVEMAEQRRTGRHVSRAWLAVTFVLVLLLVGGCSEDNPEPEPLDPAPSAASGTPSPTAKPTGAPTLPPEARGTSDKAAIAFVEHVIEVLNYSAKTLDTRALTRLSSPDCAACEGIIRRTQQIRADSGHIDGGAWSPVETQVMTGGSNRFRQVQAVLDYDEQVLVEAKGSKEQRYPAGRTVYVFDLERSGGGWRVKAIVGGGS